MSTRARAVVRAPGYDVARALALLGMVMVNFRGVLQAEVGAWPWLVWFADRVEGKAGALFVLLAGVGISLRTHGLGDDDDPRTHRRALLERATILIAAGLLLMHLWEWDILHFHGVYLLLAIPLLRVRTPVLWVLAALSVWVAVVLYCQLDWNLQPSLSTIHGTLRHLFFNGLYPVFPWMAFVLVGMAVGRLDLTDPRVRRRVLIGALAVVVASEVVDTVARHEQATGAFGFGELAPWLRTWPRAPRPLFVVSGCALGVVVICVCISIARVFAERRVIVALIATGQLALSLYVGHVIAILVPVEHGLLRGAPLVLAYAYGLAFYAFAIAFALWWRRRWEYGPLEGLIRQVTGRERPAPWGGTRLRGRDR